MVEGRRRAAAWPLTAAIKMEEDMVDGEEERGVDGAEALGP